MSAKRRPTGIVQQQVVALDDDHACRRLDYARTRPGHLHRSVEAGHGDVLSVVCNQSIEGRQQTAGVEGVWCPLARPVATVFEHGVVEVEPVHLEDRGQAGGLLVEGCRQAHGERALPHTWRTRHRDDVATRPIPPEDPVEEFIVQAHAGRTVAQGRHRRRVTEQADLMAMPAATTVSPQLTDTEIHFVLPDPKKQYDAVTLYQELQRPRESPVATWHDGAWLARIPRVDLIADGPNRMEYAFVVTHADGGQEFRTDPGNPHVADGPFGGKSVLEFPAYTRPPWLDEPPPPAGVGEIRWHEIGLPRFRDSVACGIWQPATATDTAALPLLIVHDGPEFDSLGQLTRLLSLAVADGRIPPIRAALLAPLNGRRNETYSASAHFSDAVATAVLDHLRVHAPQPEGHRPAVMGASLGGVAALHAAHRHPGAFGDLILLSGSYFRARTDKHESGYAHFNRISRFVGRLSTGRATMPVRTIAIIVGTVEENFANNLVMANGLEAAGHDVRLTTFRDGHTYTAWRDTLDPALLDVLQTGLSTRHITGSPA